jgi:hypothetical protein
MFGYRPSGPRSDSRPIFEFPHRLCRAGNQLYRPGAWLTVELVPQSFLRANGVNMLAAVAVGMLESRAFAEISKERWKQIVVSYLSSFPAFPRALRQNLNPKSVNHVPVYTIPKITRAGLPAAAKRVDYRQSFVVGPQGPTGRPHCFGPEGHFQTSAQPGRAGNQSRE